MHRRILVIEDNPASLALMTYLLRACRYEIIIAVNGAEGLELAHRELLDLIICDVNLPVFDGWEVVRRLKNHPALRTIPVVAVTALAMVGDRDKVLAAGFDGYIGKPIVPELFALQIDSFIKKKGVS